MAIEKFASIPFSQIADIGIHMNTSTNKLTAAQVKAQYNADFVAKNIKEGITIFGVTGTYTGV